jgi:hypothetical protein
MPLIIFSVNTAYLNAAAVQPFGIRPDGSFLLTHRLAYDLPPETNFTLKHVSFAGDGFSGGGGGRSNKPTIWLGVDFPQLTDEIYTNQSISEHFLNESGEGPFNNNFGVLRFPITTYPVNGVNATSGDSNVVDRFFNGGGALQYEHRCVHELNIPLGKVHMDENRIVCTVTPRDGAGRTAGYSSSADRTCRMRHMQVILEYN